MPVAPTVSGLKPLMLTALIQAVMVVGLIPTAAWAEAVAKQERGTTGTGSEQRCAWRIVSYLKRAVVQRAEVSKRELRARADVNEERSIALEEEDGQRKARNDTQQRIKEAMDRLEAVKGEIDRFDGDTFKEYGDIPHVCITQVLVKRKLNLTAPMASLWDKFLFQLNIFLVHTEVYWETLYGVVLFTVEEYREPYKKSYNELVFHYNRRVQAEYEELKALKVYEHSQENAPKLGLTLNAGRFVYLSAKIATYTAVPLITQVFVVLLVILFFPFILSAVVLSNFVWRLWLQLFVAYHIYGLTTNGIRQSLWDYAGLVTSQNWGTLQERMTKAVLTLAQNGSEGTHFSIVCAMLLIFFTVLAMVALMVVWAHLPLAVICSRGRRNEKAGKQAHGSASMPASAVTRGTKRCGGLNNSRLSKGKSAVKKTIGNGGIHPL